MRLVLYTGKGGVGKTTTAAASGGLRRASAAGARSWPRPTRRTAWATCSSVGSAPEPQRGRAGSRRRRDRRPRRDARATGGASATTWSRSSGTRASRPWWPTSWRCCRAPRRSTTLLAVEEFAGSGAYDLVVVDCAPTDATLRLVTLPDVAHRSLRILLPAASRRSRASRCRSRASSSRCRCPAPEVFRDVEELLYRQLRALRRRLIAPDDERAHRGDARAHGDRRGAPRLTELALFELRCDAVVMNRLLPAEAARRGLLPRTGAACRRSGGARSKSSSPRFPCWRAPLQDDEVTGLERLAALGAQLFARRRAGRRALAGAAHALRARRARTIWRVVPLPGADRSGSTWRRSTTS